MRSANAKNQAGFTLIELMIVVVLSVLLLLTASTLFITLLIGNTKTGGVSSVKTEGEAATEQISFLLRNALEVLPNSQNQTCQLGMSELKLRALDGGEYTLRAQEDPPQSGEYKIASAAATVSRTNYLTTNNVELVPASTSRLVFDCSQSASSGTSVKVTFTLRKGIPGIDQPKDIVEQTFVTQTTLRNK